MHIKRLILTQFRSHESLKLDTGPGFIAISGANGAGKTNILEACSLLSPGRGLRGSAFADMARQNGDGGFAVAARLADDVSAMPALDIGTAVLADTPSKRVVQINGAAVSANRISEYLAVVWLTPAMDRLFADTAGARRRFLDRLVLAVEPAHGQHATRYEAAMRARTKLLTGEAPDDAAWLTALEAQMALHGAAMDAARRRLVADLDAAIKADSADFLASPALQIIASVGAPEQWDEDNLVAALHVGRARDAAAGRALAGPHRSDLNVMHRAKDMPAASSSTGEQKAMLIRIVLAHTALVAQRSGRAPLLLLDEVAAHLDPERRAALYERLAQTGAQVWMTGTDAALFDALPGPALHFHLNVSGFNPAH
jgi:DNA replication and repair protein RecF